ncbi:MAG TPA: PEP-CTERM sorting domain-containing protein [Bryobacteraceae bacterium]|nr:PEP-CTERM sorting domain-containing protein [Bryobacteraceae bacterium]
MNFRQSSLLAGVAVGLSLFASSATATTIVSVEGPPSIGFGVGGTEGALAVSWSQSQTYTDVAITAVLGSFLVGETALADAYLTTRIGPGTTIADQIASSHVTIPGTDPIAITLFSDLVLSPGQYFITLSAAAGVNPTPGWTNTDSPTVTVDTGVSNGPVYGTFAVPSLYPPASPFTPVSVSLLYTVTSIPEPGTLWLLGTSLCGLVCWRRKGVMVEPFAKEAFEAISPRGSCRVRRARTALST